eukprot:2446184-Pleurochrysis_carterae.AAC.5
MNGAGAAAAEQGERATAQPGAGSPGSEPRSGTDAAGGSCVADGPHVSVTMLVCTGGQAPNRRTRCIFGRTGEREQERQDAREWAELRAAVEAARLATAEAQRDEASAKAQLNDKLLKVMTLPRRWPISSARRRRRRKRTPQT